jgi:Ser/Thr protein kinase RdoA (MazF antagonist)
MERHQEIQFNSIKWRTFSKEDVENVFDESFNRTVVKQNPLRTVTAVYEKDSSSLQYFLKHDHARSWKAKLKHLLRSKVKNEFDSAQLLSKHNIPCVNYIAWGEKGFEGYLLTEALKDSQDLTVTWQNIKGDPRLRKRFISALTDLLAKTLEAEVFHPDLHIGNILVARQEDDFILKYVDVYGVEESSRLSADQKLNMLVILVLFYRDLPPFEAKHLLASFAHFFPFTDSELRQEIFRVWSQRANRFRVKRRKKMLKQSSQINYTRTEEGIWRTVKDLRISDARAILQRHREMVLKAPNQLIKVDKKRRLSRVSMDGKSYVVKEFRKVRFKGGFAPDRRSWLNAFGLGTVGVPVCRYLAWLQSSQGGYIIMEDLGNNLMHFELLRLRDHPDRLYSLLMKLIEIMALLHKCRIICQDAKMSNFIVGSDNIVRMIDLDNVIFDSYPSMQDRLVTFKVMTKTMPVELTRLQVLRLLSYYRLEVGVSKSQIKWLLKNVNNE